MIQPRRQSAFRLASRGVRLVKTPSAAPGEVSISGEAIASAFRLAALHPVAPAAALGVFTKRTSPGCQAKSTCSWPPRLVFSPSALPDLPS